MSAVIHTEGLSKAFRIYQKKPGLLGSVGSLFKRDYRSNLAVEDFNLQINAGEFVGLLGPNGAGKTTLMKMFTGIIFPSSGNLTVLGHRPSDRPMEFRKKIALIMGQKSQLWWDIPAMDSFRLLCSYYEVEKPLFDRRLEELGSLLGCSEQFNIHVRKLSLGERMKMELIACLLHQPEVIFLDEPTIGLDVVAQRNIRQFLLNYQKEYGTTIILTSHYMADISALCRRIVLVQGGKKCFDDRIERFEDYLGDDRLVTFRFEQPVDANSWRIDQVEPHWESGGLGVQVRIPTRDLRAICAEILSSYPVIDILTEKTPIERVMEELLAKPDIGGSL